MEDILVLVPALFLFGRPVAAWLARRPWKVGVVRMPADQWGITAQGSVVHRELHPAGPVPAERIAELADEVRRGRFAPNGT